MHDDDVTVRSLILRVNDVELVCLDGCFTLRTIAGDDDTTFWDKIEVTAESFDELARVTRLLFTQPELSDVLAVVTRVKAIWTGWNLEDSNHLHISPTKSTEKGLDDVE